MREPGETDGTYAYTPFQDRNVSGSDILSRGKESL